MRSWRPFCCGLPDLIRSISMPSLSHRTESFDRLNKALGEAKGTPLSVLIAAGRRPNSSKARSFLVGRFYRRSGKYRGIPTPNLTTKSQRAIRDIFDR